MDVVHTFVLGILQGITEFLPISSSAHLILMPLFNGWEDQGVAFDLAVHVGTLLAVLLYFRRDVMVLVHDGVQSLIQRRRVGQSVLAGAIVLGTIPTGIAGLLLLDLIDTTLRSVQVIFVTTVVFGALLGWADYSGKRTRQIESITWKDALLVGLAQAVSLIPGTSRSGATITAGLMLGLDRQAASRFSFLLAIPITALAASVKLLQVANENIAVDWLAFLIGGVVSFITALTAIHFFLKWLNRFGMWPYVIYRMLLAAVIYTLLFRQAESLALACVAIVGGFVLLVWSADRFVDGAAATANHAGMPALLIGMVIVGFGTSAPEMVVSAFAAAAGNPGLALGNAYGSNIVNIALVLGVTAMITPIIVHSKIIRKELPILIVLGLFSGWLFWDGELSFLDAVMLLVGFFALIGWSIFSALRHRDDVLEQEIQQELASHAMSLSKALFWLLAGLLLLIVSSRVLVWGSVFIAHELGISDLVIGLTIVALGTSLPELAASVVAVRKGEHDIALGNVIGSNMFNLLAVVGIAGIIAPTTIEPEVLTRDWPSMFGLMLVLFLMAFRLHGPGRINHLEGFLLVLFYLAYNGYLAYGILQT